MSAKPTKRTKRASRTDWARVDALTDDDIAAAVADDPEAAPIFTEAMLAEIATHDAEPKALISLRLDRSVAEFFKATGKGYSTRINEVLRSYVNAQRRRPTGQ